MYHQPVCSGTRQPSPRLRLGLSSYRATLSDALSRVCRADYVSDEVWLAMLSNLLYTWFKFEPDIIDKMGCKSVFDLISSQLNDSLNKKG